jgi:hypothetical protein
MPSTDQSALDFLAGLEAKYAKLGEQIAFIRAELGLDPTEIPPPGSAGSAQASAGVPASSRPGQIRSDQFFGMSIPQAVKEYLGIMKQPQGPKTIENALRAGGLITTSNQFYANLSTALKRLRDQGEVINLPGGVWGMAAWYKGRAQMAEKPGAKKKGAKKKRAGKQMARGASSAPAAKAASPAGGASSTTWKAFLAERTRAGKTMKEASEEWAAQKAAGQTSAL